MTLPSDCATPPPLCIIIPTYNRAAALKLCLQHLERQTFAFFEVVVVDDGSTDSTQDEMQDYILAPKLSLRYVRQKNSGPARARNLAVSMAAAPLCVFIGDDILCSPGFAAAHLGFHRQRPGLAQAGLGLTQWASVGQTVTPFMRWMDQSGAQFDYQALKAGTPPDWRHFYTSNLSLKTELLRKHPFDERFTKAMVEDVELGYRLMMLEELEIGFLPEALADHLHPTDFRGACRRAYSIGYFWRLFEEIWPDQPRAVHGRLHRASRELLYRNRWLLTPLTSSAAAITAIHCPNPLIRPVLDFHMGLGYRTRIEA